MIKKISEKDKKDWLNFISNNEKLTDKETPEKKNFLIYSEKTIDLHGCSLENANKIVEEFIFLCFSENVRKVHIITGKGSRSKNKENPYLSENLSILKYSVPEFIKTKHNLMKVIKDINYDDVEDPSVGSFDILLKKKLKNKF